MTMPDHKSPRHRMKTLASGQWPRFCPCYERMADRVGFEPTVRFPPRSFSKAVPSASRPPIQRGVCIAIGACLGKPYCTRFIAFYRDKSRGLGSDGDSLCEVGDQVLYRLDSDGQAQQIARDGTVRAFDAGAMFDQAFDAAERGCARKEFSVRRHGNSGGWAVAHPDRQHTAKAAGHLAECYFVLGVALQTGVQDLGNTGMAFEIARDVERVGGCGADSWIERPHAAQQKPAFERTQDSAQVPANRFDAVPVIVVSSGYQGASDHVA